MAALAGLATFDPDIVFHVGPYVAVVIFLTGKPGRLRMSTTVFASAAYLAWIIASSAWAVNPLAHQTIPIWTALFVMFIAALDLIKTVPQLRAVAVGYLVGAFLAVSRLVATNFDSIMSGAQQRYTLDDLNQNYIGYALVTGLALIPLLWHTKPRTLRIRWALITTTLAILLGVQLTGTRGAFISAAAFALWLLACNLPGKPPLRALVVIILAVAVVIATGVLDNFARAIDFGSRSTGDLSGRIPLWETARTIWGEHFFTGAGMWASRHVSIGNIDAHNVFLEIGSSLGVIGLVLFVCLIWSALRMPRGASRLHALLLGAFLASAAAPYLSGVWEPSPASWILLAVFARISVLDGPRFATIPELRVGMIRREDTLTRVRRARP